MGQLCGDLLSDLLRHFGLICVGIVVAICLAVVGRMFGQMFGRYLGRILRGFFGQVLVTLGSGYIRSCFHDLQQHDPWIMYLVDVREKQVFF